MYDIALKKIVVFDLDKTLSESKQSIDDEMATLLVGLIRRIPIAIMSGGRYEQIRKQFIDHVSHDAEMRSNLFIFPACGACFYHFDNGWICVYKEVFAKEEKDEIRAALLDSLPEGGFSVPETLYGEMIEDRETQMTFSAFGQDAPRHVKEPWDPDGAKRLRIVAALKKRVPQFEVRIGGASSIDVTRKGIDKAYGIAQIEKHLGFQKPEMLFVGDALFEGGNDYPVKAAGVDCIEVKGPDDTKRHIREWLSTVQS